mgnify:CR=1 FL=1
MIVVSPTVFTSAKYDSEEGLSFVNPLIVNVIWIESDGQRIEGFSN